MKTVTLYTTESCPNCRIIKRVLESFPIVVQQFTLHYDSPEIETLGIHSVPTLIIQEDEKEIGRLTGNPARHIIEAFFKDKGIL